MPILDPSASQLLVIDVQTRLMPAIKGAEALLVNIDRLVEAAAIFGIPVLFTEQNAEGLGPTVEVLPMRPRTVVAKMSFDACRTPGFFDQLRPERPAIVIAGCEAHVCVLQTALGLVAAGWSVAVVEDAIGARKEASRQAAIARLVRHGVELVTTEMVLFEWLGTADCARFKDVIALIR